MGQPSSFWFAVLLAGIVRAATTNESWRSAVVSCFCGAVIAYMLTGSVMHWLALPQAPYFPAVAFIVGTIGQSAVRLVISITSVSVLAELVRAWRGK
ncbi:hypothetical protein CNY89_19140 [Amaricoccus sp. HAR-UPW-R2A-40]|nr:hypothetical protein CNY89_19140 [Amaricoccus sp. HAR-UPW-R2A-40]